MVTIGYTDVMATAAEAFVTNTAITNVSKDFLLSATIQWPSSHSQMKMNHVDFFSSYFPFRVHFN